MSLPVTIEGKTYFVTLPSAPDIQRFQQWLQADFRKRSFAAIPAGLSDAELKRFIRLINEEAAAISFRDFRLMLDSPDGMAVFFFAMLRQENPNLTLDDVAQIVQRAAEEKPAAIAGLHEVKEAFQQLSLAKKNELEAAAKARAATQAAATQATEPELAAISSPSTAASPSGTG